MVKEKRIIVDAERIAIADHHAQMIYAYLSGLSDGNGKLASSGFAERARMLFDIVRELREDTS
jgi:hypothetical protein